MNTRVCGRSAAKPQVRVYKDQSRFTERRHSGTASQGNKKKIFGIFGITLGSVLVLGFVMLLVLGRIKLPQTEPEKVEYISLTEAIPEPVVEEVQEVTEEPEVLGANVATSKYGDVIKNEDYLRENNIFVKEGMETDCVTLGFCGDILFDDEYAVMASLKMRGGNISSSISEETLDVMNGVDVMVVNNEFPFTQRGSRLPNKQYTFHADYDTAYYLNDMGADVAILANNHAYDFGEEGLLDTLDTLNNVGVHPVGAGRNLTEAVTPVYYIINDIKIAVVAASQIERLPNPDTKGATETSPGVFRCWENDLIYTAVEVAKQNADFVVACIHWGRELDENPDTWQLNMAPKLAEAGADLIIGDHTHRLQGIYYYGNTPCIYSLGNFWFNGSTLDTCLVTATVDKNGLKSFQFLPAIQSNSSTRLVGGNEGARIINYMRSLSPGAIISDEGFVAPLGQG